MELSFKMASTLFWRAILAPIFILSLFCCVHGRSQLKTIAFVGDSTAFRLSESFVNALSCRSVMMENALSGRIPNKAYWSLGGNSSDSYAL